MTPETSAKPARRRKPTSSAFALLMVIGLVALLVAVPLVVVPYLFDHATFEPSPTQQHP
ncbi:MAG TPA: hypothetical protein VFG42_05730 [Baekduia sp.]|uniref:hypothetical protein n=1 Tax=Baekduia sp. TaxID=2600305 RepID=UPI002D79AACD|nr:hypothetical protein [Baekduia sp.]HET6506267.1 hypothetical protein [Baekduia sp.]